MNIKRSISSLLITVILLTAASCGSSGPTTEATGSGTAAQTSATVASEPEESGRAAIKDDLPDKNYNGKTFMIVDRTQYDDEFTAPEITGSVMNDAIHDRNVKVEERFNIKIATHATDGTWSKATEWNEALTASIMAGDGAYDLVAGYAATIPQLVSSRIFYNWAELQYVDFTKPWWSEKVADELTINGKTFLAAGDLSTALWKGMTCLFFNKQLAEDYKIPDLYDLVRSGNWTFDKLESFTKDTYTDLDGDGKATDADAYGFLCGWSIEVDCMKEAFEVNVTVKGSDGYPVIAYKNEHSAEVLQKVNSFLHDSGIAYFDSKADRVKLEAIFAEDRALFLTDKLGSSEGLRDMESDFGIIPYPKWNEKQDSYHSTSHDEFSVFLIPIDAKDTEFTSIITVAMSAENYRNVIPTFYDVVLKTKNTRDEDSAEMIDLIRDVLVFNFGYLHSKALGSVGHLFVNEVRQNNNNLASDFDKNAATYQAKLEEVLSVYKEGK